MLSGAVDVRSCCKSSNLFNVAQDFDFFFFKLQSVNVLKMVFTKMVFVCLKNATPTTIYGCFVSVWGKLLF